MAIWRYDDMAYGGEVIVRVVVGLRAMTHPSTQLYHKNRDAETENRIRNTVLQLTSEE